ncbi:MAG: pilus assembly protein [Rhizobiales bacterium]|nr:pilus assembly protein [Hyphomicrobiales bacterium]MBI3673684.1 pilus assembly protein [Hyphomicrobiales bacterium]
MWGKLRAWRKTVLRRFNSSERGAAAVEFALVAAPFFFVLGSIAETGLMLFSEYVLQNSVQEAARLVRTGQVSASDGTTTVSAADFKTNMCSQVSIIIDCNSKVTVYVNSAASFSALDTSLGDPTSIGPNAAGAPYATVYTPGGQLKSVAVVATYDWYFTFPFMDFLGNINGGKARRLYGLAVFRNEPF